MMRRTLFFLVLGAFLALASSAGAGGGTSASGVDYSATIEKITKLAKEQMDTYNVVGLSLALVDGQNVVWQQGFGYADKAEEVEATADTVYEIGSNSKPITAIAVMQMVEQGKIHLDFPIKYYVPAFSIQSRFPETSAWSVTPRVLMSNHSGIPYIAPPITGYSYRPELMHQVPKNLKKDWLAYRPNTVYAYSNLGGALVGLMVESASGQDFFTYTQEHIFDPLQMGLTSFAPLAKLDPYLSKSYDAGGNEVKRLFMNYPPAGGAYSTASDLTHFLKVLLAKGTYNGKTLFEPASLEEMWAPQNLGVALDFDYQVGLYWLLFDPEMKYAGEVIGFAGDTVHQHSRFIILPDHDLAVVVLTNSALGGGVARTLSVETLKSALKQKTGISPPPKPTHPPQKKMSAKQLAVYKGIYASMAGSVVNITPKDGYLLVRTFAGTSYKLVPLKNGNFLAADFPGMEDYEFSFETVKGYRLFTQVWYGEKMLPFLTKVNPPAPGKAWLNRLGTYNIKMQSDYYPYYKKAKLVLQNGILTLVVDDRFYYALGVTSNTTAVMQGLSTYLGETVRIEKQTGLERLIFQNYAFEKASD